MVRLLESLKPGDRYMTQPLSMALDGLSEAERALVEAVGRGEPVDLKRKAVRGEVLADLLREARPGWQVPDAGVRITRAIVTGGLDLEGCVLTKPFLMRHSRLEGQGSNGALNIRDAKLKRLGLHSSTIEGAIMADRVEIDNGLYIGGGVVRGALQIRGGSIGGALALEACEAGDGQVSLRATGTRVSGPLILRRSQLAGDVMIGRMHLGSGLYAEECSIKGASVAIDGQSLTTEGDVLLEKSILTGGMRLNNASVGGRFAADGAQATAEEVAIDASGINIAQGLNMQGAKLDGAFVLDGAQIEKGVNTGGIEVNGGATAIAADVVIVGGNWDLARSKLVGHVRFAGADINGQLRFTESRLFGSDLALRADGARIRGGCYFTRAVVIGLMRFPAAQIGNQFRFSGASLKVDRGIVLLASGAHFDRDVQLGAGMQSVGALVFDQARIRGVLDIRDGELCSAAISRTTTQGGPRPGASRGEDARFDDIAISLVDAEIGRLQMPQGVANRPKGIIDLSRAQAGSYEDFAAAWPPSLQERHLSEDGRDIDHLVLDGFCYEHLSNPSGAGRTSTAAGERVAGPRLRWLEGQNARDLDEHFKPQSWVQLGTRLEAQGYHDDAREILIARRRRERMSRSATSGQRLQGAILDVFALYGYNPWRTVLWMVVFVLGFAAVWGWAARSCADPGCRDESAFVITNRDAYTPNNFRASYPPFNSLGYSFDMFVPFVSFGYADHWRANVSWKPFASIPLPIGDRAATTVQGSRSGSAEERDRLTLTVGGLLYVLGIVEIILGLVLTSLAVTGFTGLLARDRTS